MTELSQYGANGSYVEGSIFLRVLGSPGRVKMLAVLLGKHYKELSAAQIADLAGIDVSTFHRNVDTFVDIGIVEETRTVGGTQLYQLDTEHPVSKALGKTRWALLEQVGAANQPDTGEGDEDDTAATESGADT